MDMDPVWLGPGLLALRWMAMLQVQVVWRRSIGPIWTVVAAGLALLLASAPGMAITPEGGVGDPWTAAIAELVLGGMIGLCVALPGHALVGAAQASSQLLGTTSGPWKALTLCLTGAVALGLGLHRPLLVAGQAMQEAWPLGQPQVWASMAATLPVARLAHAMALLALTLATPALLAGAMAELALRLVGAGPTAVGPTASTVAPWARTAAALVATGASWAAYDAIWAQRVVVEGLVAG